ncbi:MAG: nicotinate-nucleotide--dimethylbenzimidazole phosphoribosyltransferase [Hespellia sp.]|nr:nicotinate-nucleotide--dimethylbenzimidazole phosphoribosyltransferase [Hespellia sp.]
MNLEQIRGKIEEPDQESMEAAKRRWTSVAKPLYSLGKLENAVIQMAGIKRTSAYTLDKKGLIIMCADNGIVEEGVTQTGQEVTAAVADNFTKDEASVCMMSKSAGVDVFPVDIGMASDVTSVTKKEQKVAYGTKNFAKGPAMTEKEVWRAIGVGIEMVSKLQKEGYDILAVGEMGIGNTTTSSAVASVLLDVSVEEVTGKGAGLSDRGLQKKIAVIKEAVSRMQPDPKDVIDVLSKVGGLDIAGMAGVFLGGALSHVPIVMDGFISSVAALCAVRLEPKAKAYILPSHVSKEPAGARMLEALGVSPILTCDMCLGEGSGAVAAIPIYEMGLLVYRRMGTFEEMDIEKYQDYTETLETQKGISK